ncbi:DUF2235 domain-containing protein [Enterovibrio norvegicus]|uniref:DUF2235 domain-containing protein n=1 Tax=Enterovibrio norvegicus TaxID=188144 RepID=UPI0013D389C7|nr:DUF2235 domain-containing protein [Enterovibrio norvegicus]
MTSDGARKNPFRAKSQQRLIVLFDGTWNDPQDQTNVYRLAKCIKPFDEHGVRQRFFYDPGVGTSAATRFLGGTSGWGLTKNLLQGYEWLAKYCHSQEEIWVFGFSRGAYTARSLGGIVRMCGLLKIVTPDLLKRAMALYSNPSLSRDSEASVNFRRNFSRDVDIHFMGVWDTVGALGVPGTILSEKGVFSWHDTTLSDSIKHAFHAMALDEHRSAYNAALWTCNANTEMRPIEEVEQRWFIGAHANVGGGYPNDTLREIPFGWIAEKAVGLGLDLEMSQHVFTDDPWRKQPRDSFHEFIRGFYAAFQRFRGKGDENGRFYRAYNLGRGGLTALNVRVDPSVWKRWQALDYRPQTLVNAKQIPPS